MDLQKWFATCPKGLESLLLEELRQLGADSVRETIAGVYFEGPLAMAYRACLWSRLANRVLLPVAQFPVDSADDLYQGVKAADWRNLLDPRASLLVDFTGQNRSVRNTQFGAQRTKDAIVDYFVESGQPRPAVARQNPDARVNVRLHKGIASLALDFGGESLHKRGYREEAGQAPLKENLAAALLLRADWPGIAARGGALIDPMCGSGTLLLEGAMMVMDIAPGLARTRWGFAHLPFHHKDQWEALHNDAKGRAELGKSRQAPEIRGYDDDNRVLLKAQANIERAGLSDVVRVVCKDLARLKKPTHKPLEHGLVICNPPYGERMGDKESLRFLYRQLGDTLVREFSGWQGAVFTADPELGLATGLHSHKRYALWNGALASQLLLFELGESIHKRERAPAPNADAQSETATTAPLSEGAGMFANRLAKNMKLVSRWARREGRSCYRLYDADMPEYAVAIDRYGDALHVAEYRAPKTIDEADAARRLEEVRQVLPGVTGVPSEQIFYKQRQRQRGTGQYQRLSSSGELRSIEEGGVKLLVNLSDYLDTGLFLDHRPLRLRLAQESRGQDFLNLFCYTASASIHAAAGGARSTTSVDMSRTYLDWARKNFAANGFGERQHALVQANCLEWLATDHRSYDLILLDPPSFSNSKRMEESFDIQRDHVELLRLALGRLSDNGTLYFSSNLRGFRLDPAVDDFCEAEDITASTIDFDFKRRPKIHCCFRIAKR
jgi:23S rRNA (guanine2445-N2)-methyltransferase / 23S rRNA (guanine2069-N7)-methyltransferase